MPEMGRKLQLQMAIFLRKETVKTIVRNSIVQRELKAKQERKANQQK